MLSFLRNQVPPGKDNRYPMLSIALTVDIWVFTHAKRMQPFLYMLTDSAENMRLYREPLITMNSNQFNKEDGL